MTLLISIFVSNRDIAREAGSSSKSSLYPPPHCHSYPVYFRFKGSDVVDEVSIGDFLTIRNLMPGYEEDGIGTTDLFIGRSGLSHALSTSSQLIRQRGGSNMAIRATE